MNFLQRLKDGANKASEKAQGVVEINKLNSQISEIEHRRSSYYTEMGRVFYEGYRSQDMSIAEKEMVELAKACDSLQGEIDELRRRVAVLKNERLCQCGRTVALDANFCPYCGSRIESEPVRRAAGSERRAEAPAQAVGESQESRDVYTEEMVIPNIEDDRDDYLYRAEPEQAAKPQIQDEPVYLQDDEEDEELLRMEEEERERERRHLEELERERERQLELDRRIRFWKENNQQQEAAAVEGPRDMVKCQICSADLAKGSHWCPRCGAEQI